jgi:hypothetical protein
MSPNPHPLKLLYYRYSQTFLINMDIKEMYVSEPILYYFSLCDTRSALEKYPITSVSLKNILLAGETI